MQTAREPTPIGLKLALGVGVTTALFLIVGIVWAAAPGEKVPSSEAMPQSVAWCDRLEVAANGGFESMDALLAEPPPVVESTRLEIAIGQAREVWTTGESYEGEASLAVDNLIAACQSVGWEA